MDVTLAALQMRDPMLKANVNLARYTRLGIGGAADWYFEPDSLQQLSQFLASRPRDVAVTPIGLGSNLLVRDGGVDGVVLRLNASCDGIETNDTVVVAGAGVSSRKLSKHAAMLGLSGLEFLSGVPGEVGGALAMNAGAFGQCMADVVTDVDFIDPNGGMHRLSAESLRFGYRHAGIPSGWIVIRVAFRCERRSIDEVGKRIEAMEAARRAYQPIRGRTAGSTFRNPPDHHARMLIAEAGCRGLRIGDAWVSERNPNFFFNLGGASSDDMETLIETVKDRVMRTCGVALELELKIIGRRSATSSPARGEP